MHAVLHAPARLHEGLGLGGRAVQQIHEALRGPGGHDVGEGGGIGGLAAEDAHFRVEQGAGAAAQHGHVVTAPEQFIRDKGPEKSGTPENQDTHRSVSRVPNLRFAICDLKFIISETPPGPGFPPSAWEAACYPVLRQSAPPRAEREHAHRRAGGTARVGPAHSGVRAERGGDGFRGLIGLPDTFLFFRGEIGHPAAFFHHGHDIGAVIAQPLGQFLGRPGGLRQEGGARGRVYEQSPGLDDRP